MPQSDNINNTPTGADQMTTFQIVEIQPNYCRITDAMIGSTAYPRPMSYKSEELAHKLAGRLHDQEYQNCGDGIFVVVPYGQSAFARRIVKQAAIAAFDDMPF